MCDFLSPGHSEAIVGLLIGLISTLCLREEAGLRRGSDGGPAGRGSSENTHL